MSPAAPSDSIDKAIPALYGEIMTFADLSPAPDNAELNRESAKAVLPASGASALTGFEDLAGRVVIISFAAGASCASWLDADFLGVPQEATAMAASA